MPLCEAVENQEIIKFEYEDRLREVKPTKVGKSTSGNDIMEAFQHGGRSKSDDVPFWRTYRLDKISELEFTGIQNKGVGKEYERNDTRFEKIYCEL